MTNDFGQDQLKGEKRETYPDCVRKGRKNMKSAVGKLDKFYVLLCDAIFTFRYFMFTFFTSSEMVIINIIFTPNQILCFDICLCNPRRMKNYFYSPDLTEIRAYRRPRHRFLFWFSCGWFPHTHTPTSNIVVPVFCMQSRGKCTCDQIWSV